MDSGYFDEEIIRTIESFNCKYLIKAKAYPTLTTKVTDSQISFIEGEEGRETMELFTKLNTWNKKRRCVISRVLKPENDRVNYQFYLVKITDISYLLPIQT